MNNKMSLEQVRALAPSFDWNQYLKLVGAPAPHHYIVSSPKYFKGLEQELKQRSVEDWKAYLRWFAVHDSAPYLTTAFVDENWDFFSRTLLGAKQQRPRWRRCVAAADRDLGDALGQAYVAKAFPAESKERMLDMWTERILRVRNRHDARATRQTNRWLDSNHATRIRRAHDASIRLRSERHRCKVRRHRRARA